MEEHNHDDFEVVRVDDRYGGFEELQHKDPSMSHTRFIRKSVEPGDHVEFENLMALQRHIMTEGCSGATHPIYTHEDRKWSLMSVPEHHYEATGLAT